MILLFEILDKFLSIEKITELKELLCSSKIGIQGIEELEFIFKNLENLGLKTSKLKFDITLARGIDYYTGCILEVKQKNINIMIGINFCIKRRKNNASKRKISRLRNL